jgi:hypothetical protein
MATTYRFIADPNEPSPVLAWFREADSPPQETIINGGHVLYFADCGPISYMLDERVDPQSSPIVTLIHPQIKRGVLWTVGEVHFLSTSLRRKFPELQRINATFRKWLSGFECVFGNLNTESNFDYYLEGSIRNYDSAVYGFASGLTALKQGQYFVDHSDNTDRLNTICKTLALRGIECTA